MAYASTARAGQKLTGHGCWDMALAVFALQRGGGTRRLTAAPCSAVGQAQILRLAGSAVSGQIARGDYLRAEATVPMIQARAVFIF